MSDEGSMFSVHGRSTGEARKRRPNQDGKSSMPSRLTDHKCSYKNRTSVWDDRKARAFSLGGWFVACSIRGLEGGEGSRTGDAEPRMPIAPAQYIWKDAAYCMRAPIVTGARIESA